MEWREATAWVAVQGTEGWEVAGRAEAVLSSIHFLLNSAPMNLNEGRVLDGVVPPLRHGPVRAPNLLHSLSTPPFTHPQFPLHSLSRFCPAITSCASRTLGGGVRKACVYKNIYYRCLMRPLNRCVLGFHGVI